VLVEVYQDAVQAWVEVAEIEVVRRQLEPACGVGLS
jgi:hypothetical protein